ncbi:MAG: acetyl-CoA C-acetyltransferase, partial [Sciscionella sp.]
GSVIVSGVRTPIGRLHGAFAGVPAVDLGAAAITGAIKQAGIGAEHVDYVIMGQVIQAGCGQNPARLASTKAGIGMSVPAMTLNKVCLSGLNAIALADLMINAGDCDVVVAGGMESMTEAPHLLPGARKGFAYGDTTLLDATAHDGLTDVYDHESMGASTERHTASLGISREEQDQLAARSHQRASEAAKNGRFDAELVAYPVPQRRGDPVVVDADEGVRQDTTAESLGKLRPAFATNGTVTAGSSSQISDGGAATVVMSKAKAKELGRTVLAEIGHHGWVAGPDNSLLCQPANAITTALRREGMAPSDLDLIEINEAFASVAIQSIRQLDVDADKVNVDGGAIALGHPIGATGARLALHLVHELHRRGGGIGAAGLCGGGGQGDAVVFRVAG